jgi:hypothetical protein
MANSEEFMVAVKAVINKVDNSILKNRTETIKLKFLINEDAIKEAQKRIVIAEANLNKIKQMGALGVMSGRTPFGSGDKALKELNAATNQYNRAMVQKAKLTAQDIDNTNKQTNVHKTFASGLQSSITRIAQYAIASGVLYSALAELRKQIQFIIDLNKEMTNIQIVGGYSKEQVQQMAKGYNELGREMGVSTLAIARGSLEFIRQGKTAEETAILIKNSTMMSKLGNMEAAQSSEALTAIMNGYNMTVEETGDVVSKLVTLDNNFASSVEEISTAMRYASSSSKQVGIDFDHLAAYITVISAKTRLPAESIGQSFPLQ